MWAWTATMGQFISAPHWPETAGSALWAAARSGRRPSAASRTPRPASARPQWIRPNLALRVLMLPPRRGSERRALPEMTALIGCPVGEEGEAPRVVGADLVEVPVA